MMQIVSVSSGKGGVGKTLTTIHMAIAAAVQGKRVLILDADVGLSNVDIVLGVKPYYTLADHIFQDVALKKTILTACDNVDIISSGSGLQELTNLSYLQRSKLMASLGSLESDYDLMLIDTGAGIHDAILHYCSFADFNLLVSTPEPHALTDAYAFVKSFSRAYTREKMFLILNQCPSDKESSAVTERLNGVSRKYLDIELVLLGRVPEDDVLKESVFRRSILKNDIWQTSSGQAWLKSYQNLSTYLFIEPRQVFNNRLEAELLM